MLKFAIEYARERSNAGGGSFCAGSTPSTTCGWLETEIEYFAKSKYTPPVAGAVNGLERVHRRQQRGRRADLDPLVGDEDAVAVAVVERARLVVERVRVAEGAPCVRIGAQRDRRSRVRSRRTPCRPCSRRSAAACRRCCRPGPSPASPRGAPSSGRRRRSRSAGRRRTASPCPCRPSSRDAEPISVWLKNSFTRAGEDDLVADDGRVVVDGVGERAREDEDAVRAERIAVGGRGGVLQEEAVRRAVERQLGDDAADGDRLPDVAARRTSCRRPSRARSPARRRSSASR